MAGVREHLTEVLRPVAAAFDLTLDAFGVQEATGSSGALSIKTAFGSFLEPSPVTPTRSSGPYAILSGTIKAVLEGSKVHPSNDVVVAPLLALGKFLINKYVRETVDDVVLDRKHRYVISLTSVRNRRTSLVN